MNVWIFVYACIDNIWQNRADMYFFFHLLYIPMTYPGDIRMCLVF
jgi:hypothetical protein